MDTLFGSAIRTETLVAVARLERTYAGEIARLLGRRTVEIRRALISLEEAGVIVTMRLGTTRIVELSPRFEARDELYALLLRMSEFPKYVKRWNVRRRPRAIGKAL